MADRTPIERLEAARPSQPLPPGRYLLDQDGRLHPISAKDAPSVYAVAAVNVLDYRKSERRAEQIRRECAAEASLHESRVREAARLTTAHPLSAPTLAEGPSRPLARRAKPGPVILPVEQISLPVEEEAAAAEFAAKLKAVRARRAKSEPMKSEPRIDGRRVAAAYREKALGPAPKKAPTRRALSDGECHRCGIRTTIGCDHFLPYLKEAQ